MTLKVSTIEQTASTADATGGKGNAKLISWDFGKDITVTIEDALFSPKSMALMFGGANAGVDTTLGTITKTINYLATQDGALPKYVKKENDGSYVVSTSDTKGADEIEVTWYKEDAQGSEDKATSATAAGERFIGQFTVSPTAMRTIEVDAAHFPGTYKIVGETYARNDANGEDELTWNSSLAA